MKVKMSLDGIQTVDVPLLQAKSKAQRLNDLWNEILIKAIDEHIQKYNRITKADFDYLVDYIGADK